MLAMGENVKMAADLHWDRIDNTLTRAAEAYGFDFGGTTLLQGIDPRVDEYGCGMWGCAYPTNDSALAVKLTYDPSEAAIVSQVLEDEFLRTHPGVAYTLGIWLLPIETSSRRGLYKTYAILRESIEPGADLPKDAEVKSLRDALHRLRNTAIDLADERKYGRSKHLLRRAEEAYDTRLAEMERHWQLEWVVDFMREFERATGAILSDLHFGNVGLRNHYNDDWISKHPAGGHGPSDKFVAFDLGHSDVQLGSEIPLVGNPIRKV